MSSEIARWENTRTNSQLFQAYVAEHLRKYGVALEAIILQTT